MSMSYRYFLHDTARHYGAAVDFDSTPNWTSDFRRLNVLENVNSINPSIPAAYISVSRQATDITVLISFKYGLPSSTVFHFFTAIASQDGPA